MTLTFASFQCKTSSVLFPKKRKSHLATQTVCYNLYETKYVSRAHTLIFSQGQQVLSHTASSARALAEKQSPAEPVTTPCPEPAEAAPARSVLVASGLSQEGSKKRRLKAPATGAGLCSGTAEKPQHSCSEHTHRRKSGLGLKFMECCLCGFEVLLLPGTSD